MADYTRTERTVTTVRYELPTPSNAAEFNKALGAASSSFRSIRGRDVSWDNDLSVTAEDDLVVISFTKED